ncbi:MAG TPA: hypothetical protein VF508_08095, partial [Pyrinomonadaceae bacterium]
GGVSPGDSLTLEWHNASAVACPRVEHKYNAGTEGVWLLTRDGQAMNANCPGRFVALSERGKVESALARSPVVLRADSYRVGLGEPMPFAVVYRNVSDAPRTFPGVAFEGGRLRLAPDMRLVVKASLDGEDRVRPARVGGRVVQDRGLAPVAVQPRSEHRVKIDLRALLASEPVEKESFDVTLRLDGRTATNEIGFYVGEPLSLRPPPPPPPPVPRGPSCVYVLTEPPREGLAPLTRAVLTALGALFLFPFFHRMRAARLARAAHGAQTWQI